MKISAMTLAALAAVTLTVMPSLARAEDDERDEERVEVRVRGRMGEGREGMRRRERPPVGEDDDDEDGPRGSRGPRGDRGGRMGHGERGGDPAMRAVFEKIRGLEDKVRELSMTLRRGSDKEKAAAKDEARKTLGELYDAKMELDAGMLEKMEKHVAMLKEKISKKKSKRAKAIESRLARMSGEDDGWD